MIAPNGVAYAPPEVRQGVLPRLLSEILATRIMVKAAMKRAPKSAKVPLLTFQLFPLSPPVNSYSLASAPPLLCVNAVSVIDVTFLSGAGTSALQQVLPASVVE